MFGTGAVSPVSMYAAWGRDPDGTKIFYVCVLEAACGIVSLGRRILDGMVVRRQ